MPSLPPTELRSQLSALHRESFVWALHCCANDAPRAEDVLQEVYLKILDGRAHFAGRSSLKTWVLALVRFTAIDEWRRAARRDSRLASLDDAAEPATESLDAELMRDEAHAGLRSALTALPVRQREALTLVFYHDLTIAEAADVMGISLGTARTHYERAKQQLREALAAQVTLP